MNLIPSRFFQDNFNDFFNVSNRDDLRCDIYEKDNIYHIELDIAGFDKNDINIEVKNNYLTITASNDAEKEDEDTNYIRRERRYGKYSRTFSLGDVKEDEIEATFENGTLLITIPKIEEDKLKRKIEIK